MEYWIYENWVAENKAVVHQGDCAFCNHGAGTGRNIRGTKNGKWHGPFGSLHEAETRAGHTGRSVRRHRCVGIGEALTRSPRFAGNSLSVSVVAPSATSAAPLQLGEFGFKPAGSWVLDPSAKGGVRFSLFEHRNDRAIYAFVVDGRVEYVGICDSARTTLNSRMLRYQNMVGAGTNARINKAIKAAIEAGAEVLIYAMIQTLGSGHSKLNVDFVKGLELPLIATLRPTWNRAGIEASQFNVGSQRQRDKRARQPLRSSESIIQIHELYGHLARFCEALWKARQKGPPPSSLASLISTLQRLQLVPAFEAGMMHTVRTVRNSHVHDHRRVGAPETQIVSAAWDVISQWAERHHADLWRGAVDLA